MTDPDAADSRAASKFFGAPAAILLAAGFVLGFAGLAVFTWRGHAQEENLESFARVSAVGDDSFFNIHTPASGSISIEHAGRRWRVSDFEKRGRRDTQMQSVGTDGITGLKIYQPIENPKADEIFLRTEPNGYVQLQPAG